MKLDKLVDRAVVLTLDKRLDLGRQLQKQVKDNLNIESNIFLAGDGHLSGAVYDHIDVKQLPPVYPESIQYATWWQRPNAFNAFLCHNKILSMAYLDNIETLFLMEDDAFIEEDFNEVLEKASVLLDKNKWDVLQLGGYHNKDTWSPTENENVMRIHGSGGWHGIILKRKIIEFLLQFKAYGPYDWMLGKFQRDFNCYAIYPSIVSQKDEVFSHVEGSVLKKPSRYIR
jgi:hypothetical protein